MRLYHVLVAVTAALLAAGSSSTAAAIKSSTLTRLDSESSNEVHDSGSWKRSLRLVEDDDGDGGDSTTTEARGGGLSALSSKVSKKIPTDVKISLWHSLGKSDDYAEKHLGLAGLSGTALTTHKNYQRLVKYVDTTEKHKMYKLARGGFLPTSVWEQQGLGKITRLTPQIKSSEGFRVYSRYANIFDDVMESTMGSGYYLPSKLISEKATPLEMTLRAQFWAEARRSDDFVRTMLGLQHLKGAKLTAHKYYSYYLKHVKPTAK
jgi:hypothetical protein